MFLNRKIICGFSLLELMAALAVVCILAAVSVTSYRSYTIRASIAALTPTADQAKNEVENAHNVGTIFGTSGNETIVASNTPNKPYALLDIVRGNYGCVTINIDLAALNLDDEQELGMVWCPTLSDGSIVWNCGYTSASFADYITYLPGVCQTVITSIQDTSF